VRRHADQAGRHLARQQALQKRFDKLAELAAADDWDAVAGYECNGVNTYAKMVRQYRDRLVAAHKAQQATA
jgi:hypothetical protein